MPRFSQRYGYSSLEQAFQREKLDEALRISLWNILNISIWNEYNKNDSYHEELTLKRWGIFWVICGVFLATISNDIASLFFDIRPACPNG